MVSENDFIYSVNMELNEVKIHDQQEQDANPSQSQAPYTWWKRATDT